MTKKTGRLLALLLAVVLVICCGACASSKHMDLPETKDIIMATVESGETDLHMQNADPYSEYISDLVTLMEDGKKSGRSKTETPEDVSYSTVIFFTADEDITVYVYEKDGTVFAEVPEKAIYECDQALLDLVTNPSIGE